MPRYYFNVLDGQTDVDLVGIELASIEGVRRETIRFAGEVLSEDMPHIRPGEDWRVEVLDASGLMLFRLDVTLSESPAVQSALQS